jgi:hypothetical protein
METLARSVQYEHRIPGRVIADNKTTIRRAAGPLTPVSRPRDELRSPSGNGDTIHAVLREVRLRAKGEAEVERVGLHPLQRPDLATRLGDNSFRSAVDWNDRDALSSRAGWRRESDRTPVRGENRGARPEDAHTPRRSVWQTRRRFERHRPELRRVSVLSITTERQPIIRRRDGDIGTGPEHVAEHVRRPAGCAVEHVQVGRILQVVDATPVARDRGVARLVTLQRE